VNKNILAAVGRSYETEPLGIVEPLDGSCFHDDYLVNLREWSVTRLSRQSAGEYFKKTSDKKPGENVAVGSVNLITHERTN
jgi:hypothetical protein